ncbi:hypothetical protein LSTR_LSTR014302 [Laodelphax striatellus]|uniref:Uncharacterized protein n=1 Tax=Laodelphax striatellus TaxID=195883 RepID=A0A482WZ08_LAOST|nr:hypothetical protein LSTR_LSTR014302 [Laodelphax striatellus]
MFSYPLPAMRCRFEKKPSVRLFRQHLRHRIQTALIQPPIGVNCEPDEDDLLEGECVTATSHHLEEEDVSAILVSDTEDEIDEPKLQISCLESCSISIEKKHPCFYVWKEGAAESEATRFQDASALDEMQLGVLQAQGLHPQTDRGCENEEKSAKDLRQHADKSNEAKKQVKTLKLIAEISLIDI